MYRFEKGETAVQKRKKKVSIRLFVLIFAALMAYAGFQFVRQEVRSAELSGEAAHLQSQIKDVQDQNEQIRRDIEYAHSDEYIERQAREKLGWVKDGEIRFVEK